MKPTFGPKPNIYIFFFFCCAIYPRTYLFYIQQSVSPNPLPDLLPPLLSPTGNHQLFFMSFESVSVLLYSFICLISQNPHVSDNIDYLSSSESFPKHNNLYTCPHCCTQNFIFMTNIPVCVCTHIFFNYCNLLYGLPKCLSGKELA